MRLIAAIQKAPFALDAEYDQLCDELIKVHGVKYIRKISNLDEINFLRDYDADSKILWFENAAVRYDIGYAIQALHVPGVGVVVGKRGNSFGRSSGQLQILGFRAGAIETKGAQLSYKMHHNFPLEMTAVQDKREYQVFVVAHKRPEYLKLSLASTFNAFVTCPNKKINLVINENRGQFDSVIKEFPELNVISLDHNLGFNTLYNLVVRNVIKKGVFFYFEDDFVLPADLETSHPLWAREFYDMAENGGFVGWRAGVYPHDYYAPSFYGEFKPETKFGQKWIFNFGSRRLLTGYGFAYNTDNVISASRLTEKITDEVLNIFSKFDASPALVGHHLGINKNIDYP